MPNDDLNWEMSDFASTPPVGQNGSHLTSIDGPDQSFRVPLEQPSAFFSENPAIQVRNDPSTLEKGLDIPDVDRNAKILDNKAGIGAFDRFMNTIPGVFEEFIGRLQRLEDGRDHREERFETYDGQRIMLKDPYLFDVRLRKPSPPPSSTFHRTAPSFEVSDLPPVPSASFSAVSGRSLPSFRGDASFQDELQSAAINTLYYSKVDSKGSKVHILNLATYQRMRLQNVQREIVKEASRIVKGKRNDSGDLDRYHEFQYEAGGRKIEEYCQGLRDLELMQDWKSRPQASDPFIVTSKRTLERQSLLNFGLEPESGEVPEAKDKDSPQLTIMPRSLAKRATDKYNAAMRFLMAAFGGAALVVPMIIMVLVPTRTASLIITSVFVLAFAAVVAWGSDLKPNEMLGVTSGYAAVLVVFVGTSLASSP